MTRVIAGEAKGRRLETLSGHAVRPTTDRVKEAMFSIAMAHIPEARVLDLCAGSGALGIEALSRGAAHCHFVENNPKACEIIRRNLSLAGFNDRATLIRQDAVATLSRLPGLGGATFQLVLADPPYKETALVHSLLAKLSSSQILDASGIALIEASSQLIDFQSLKGLKLKQRSTYGSTSVLCYVRADEG